MKYNFKCPNEHYRIDRSRVSNRCIGYICYQEDDQTYWEIIDTKPATGKVGLLDPIYKQVYVDSLNLNSIFYRFENE